MRLTFLVDNNASQILMGEWGLSIYIEEEAYKILFDLGASDLFLQNARRLGKNALEPEYIILSHGHYDHTWGLNVLINQRQLAGLWEHKPTLIAHPQAFLAKHRQNQSEFGMTIAQATIEHNFKTQLTREPYWITKNLVFLGEIKRRVPFENRKPLGKVSDLNGDFSDDFLLDDSALALKTSQGLVVISGCAHAGICNIIEHAREVCGDERVVDVIGGFHLKEPECDEEQLRETLGYLKKFNLKSVYPCHCTSLAAKVGLLQVGALHEVSVGLTIEY
ncbi:MAG TPA: MBL fold metallo-hydrolase [Bacillota bacterium]|nr:MBL fold metallo-hydrolase [Bacillota bacterium]